MQAQDTGSGPPPAPSSPVRRFLLATIWLSMMAVCLVCLVDGIPSLRRTHLGDRLMADHFASIRADAEPIHAAEPSYARQYSREESRLLADHRELVKGYTDTVRWICLALIASTVGSALHLWAKGKGRGKALVVGFLWGAMIVFHAFAALQGMYDLSRSASQVEHFAWRLHYIRPYVWSEESAPLFEARRRAILGIYETSMASYIHTGNTFSIALLILLVGFPIHLWFRRSERRRDLVPEVPPPEPADCQRRG